MSKFGFAIAGLEKLHDALESLPEDAEETAGAALFERGLGVMAVAKKKAPVDTGRLMRSGGVSNPYFDAGEVKVQLFFGVEYAPDVHETHPTQHDYLKEPLDEKSTGFQRQFVKAFRAFAGDEGKSIAILDSPTKSGAMEGQEG